MMTKFVHAVFVADEENYTNTPEGSQTLLEIFEHLAGGGTVDNVPGWERDDVVVMLAVAWRDVRDLANTMPPSDWP